MVGFKPLIGFIGGIILGYRKRQLGFFIMILCVSYDERKKEMANLYSIHLFLTH